MALGYSKAGNLGPDPEDQVFDINIKQNDPDA